MVWLLGMPPARGNEKHVAFRAMTVLRLGPGFGNLVVWGRGQLPTVTNLGLMARSRAFDGADRHAVLLDISEKTALEQADGNWEAVIPIIASGPGRSIDERAADFDRHILPARHQPRTRGKNWSYWAFVVKWGVTNNAAELLLPMSIKTLQAGVEEVILDLQSGHRLPLLREPKCISRIRVACLKS